MHACEEATPWPQQEEVWTYHPALEGLEGLEGAQSGGSGRSGPGGSLTLSSGGGTHPDSSGGDLLVLSGSWKTKASNLKRHVRPAPGTTDPTRPAGLGPGQVYVLHDVFSPLQGRLCSSAAHARSSRQDHVGPPRIHAAGNEGLELEAEEDGGESSKANLMSVMSVIRDRLQEDGLDCRALPTSARLPTDTSRSRRGYCRCQGCRPESERLFGEVPMAWEAVVKKTLKKKEDILSMQKASLLRSSGRGGPAVVEDGRCGGGQLQVQQTVQRVVPTQQQHQQRVFPRGVQQTRQQLQQQRPEQQQQQQQQQQQRTSPIIAGDQRPLAAFRWSKVGFDTEFDNCDVVLKHRFRREWPHASLRSISLPSLFYSTIRIRL